MRQKIIITGASSGIGEGLTKIWAAQGRELGIAARREEKLKSIQQSLNSDKIHPKKLDVTDIEATRKVFNELVEEMGGSVDRIVVNAGLGKGTPIGTGNAAANAETITTNLIGSLNQAEVAMEIFRKQGYGHLVFISSVASMRGLPKNLNAYAASKAGLSSLAQGLILETQKNPKLRKIIISDIKPGFIDTPLAQGSNSAMFMTPIDKGSELIAAAIEKESRSSFVPNFPWSIVSQVLRFSPVAIAKRLV